MIFNATGGSNPLNFKVVASTTEPVNPKENTIWVKTGIAIPEWEMGINRSVSWGMPAGFVYFATDIGIFDADTTYNPLKKNMIYLTYDLVWQNQGTQDNYNWVQLESWLYKNGKWVQMSSTFSATISVTYPSGSALTCTDGTTTLTATTTTGSYTFTVPNTGTWTVSCTDGDQTATDTVEITADGQSESVELSYGIYYSPGNEHTSTTGGWSAANSSSATMTFTKSDDYMMFDLVRPSWSSDGYSATLKTKNAVDLTNISTLYFDVYCKSDYKEFTFGAIPNGGSSFASKLEKGEMDSFTIARNAYKVDVSSLSGKHYIAIKIYTATTSTGALYIYNVYGK